MRATTRRGSRPSSCHVGYSHSVEPSARTAMSSPPRRMASIFPGSTAHRSASHDAERQSLASFLVSALLIRAEPSDLADQETRSASASQSASSPPPSKRADDAAVLVDDDHVRLVLGAEAPRALALSVDDRRPRPAVALDEAASPPQACSRPRSRGTRTRGDPPETLRRRPPRSGTSVTTAPRRSRTPAVRGSPRVRAACRRS